MFAAGAGGDAPFRAAGARAAGSGRLQNDFGDLMRVMSDLAGGLMPVWLLEPLSPRTARKLTALVAQPLQ